MPDLESVGVPLWQRRALTPPPLLSHAVPSPISAPKRSFTPEPTCGTYGNCDRHDSHTRSRSSPVNKASSYGSDPMPAFPLAGPMYGPRNRKHPTSSGYSRAIPNRHPTGPPAGTSGGLTAAPRPSNGGVGVPPPSSFPATVLNTIFGRSSHAQPPRTSDMSTVPTTGRGGSSGAPIARAASAMAVTAAPSEGRPRASSQHQPQRQPRSSAPPTAETYTRASAMPAGNVFAYPPPPPPELPAPARRSHGGSSSMLLPAASAAVVGGATYTRASSASGNFPAPPSEHSHAAITRRNSLGAPVAVADAINGGIFHPTGPLQRAEIPDAPTPPSAQIVPLLPQPKRPDVIPKEHNNGGGSIAATIGAAIARRFGGGNSGPPSQQPSRSASTGHAGMSQTGRSGSAPGVHSAAASGVGFNDDFDARNGIPPRWSLDVPVPRHNAAGMRPAQQAVQPPTHRDGSPPLQVTSGQHPHATAGPRVRQYPPSAGVSSVPVGGIFRPGMSAPFAPTEVPPVGVPSQAAAPAFGVPSSGAQYNPPGGPVPPSFIGEHFAGQIASSNVPSGAFTIASHTLVSYPPPIPEGNMNVNGSVPRHDNSTALRGPVKWVAGNPTETVGRSSEDRTGKPYNTAAQGYPSGGLTVLEGAPYMPPADIFGVAGRRPDPGPQPGRCSASSVPTAPAARSSSAPLGPYAAAPPAGRGPRMRDVFDFDNGPVGGNAIGVGGEVAYAPGIARGQPQLPQPNFVFPPRTSAPVNGSAFAGQHGASGVMPARDSTGGLGSTPAHPAFIMGSNGMGVDSGRVSMSESFPRRSYGLNEGYA